MSEETDTSPEEKKGLGNHFKSEESKARSVKNLRREGNSGNPWGRLGNPNKELTLGELRRREGKAAVEPLEFLLACMTGSDYLLEVCGVSQQEIDELPLTEKIKAASLAAKFMHTAKAAERSADNKDEKEVVQTVVIMPENGRETQELMEASKKALEDSEFTVNIDLPEKDSVDDNSPED